MSKRYILSFFSLRTAYIHILIIVLHIIPTCQHSSHIHKSFLFPFTIFFVTSFSLLSFIYIHFQLALLQQDAIIECTYIFIFFPHFRSRFLLSAFLLTFATLMMKCTLGLAFLVCFTIMIYRTMFPV